MSVANPSTPSDEKPRPFYGLRPSAWAIYRSTWFGVWAIDRVAFRTRTQGLETMPKAGPVLLLSNHVGLLDPFQVALHMYRPSRFMAATSVLKIPVLGKWLGALGAFPKMKYVKDRDSMRMLAEHYENGHVVTLFPEGVRTWTGEPMPVLPGIGRLIKRLNARVVFARIKSGYLLAPRWAKYPRYLPLDIEYIGPVEYPEHVTAEEITADVREKLSVQPARDKSRFAFGFRLAEGLPELLWACPHCKALDALVVPRSDRDTVSCQACRSTWRIDLDAVLNGIDGAPTMSIQEAHGALRAHFGRPAILDRHRYEQDGVIGTHPSVAVRHIPRKGERRVVAQGVMTIDHGGVRVGGTPDAPAWESSFADLLAVSTEVGDQLFVRRAGASDSGDLFRIELGKQSTYKWGSLLQDWQRHHKPIS
jgi:1-acyl-sn-glycerol-3-phosphate acyltransferase